MAKIQYKLKQYKNASSAYNNFFYPRAVSLGTFSTNEIAEKIQQNCSLKKSDVIACLAELSQVMNEALTSSYSVKLDGIGTFSAGVVTDHMVETLKEFNPAECIKRIKINFLPAYSVNQNGGRTTKLLVGAGLTEYDTYAEGVNDTKKVGSGTSAKRVAIEIGEINK